MKHQNKILGRISPSEFLAEFWQKKPCLIRQAFPDFQSPITPDELAGLACEEGIESRLVIENHPERPWLVKYGPFTEDDFKQLPASHWTLLVQAVDQHLPIIAGVLDEFNFIPSWRVDDLMISYAPEHGSVGPHLDNYDVFLLQAKGQRHWHINPDQYSEQDFTGGLELKIIDGFQSTDDWILQPGDMLYLPPGVAHHGIALDDCMTFSIGFRAYSQSELLMEFAEQFTEFYPQDLRYRDADLQQQDYPGEIQQQHLERIRQMMQSTLDNQKEFYQWFGSLITKSDYSLVDEIDTPLSLDAFISEFEKQNILYRDGQCKCVFIRFKEYLHLYINGECIDLAMDTLPVVDLISKRHAIHFTDFSSIANPTGKLLLNQLYNVGVFYFDEQT